MTHEVFICEEYAVEDGILLIYKPTLVGKVESVSAFIRLTALVKYDAIVCPDLFTDADGCKVDGFVLL